MTKEWQSASGAVGEGTPVIEYLYDAPSGEEITKAPRRIGIKYSETYTLNINYDEGLDDNISRLSSFSETIGETTRVSWRATNTWAAAPWSLALVRSALAI